MNQLYKSFDQIILNWQRVKADNYELLAQGEYNKNYVFINPKDNKKYILRINQGSQIGLENQIRYEYEALKYLQENQIKLRTPKAYFCDDTKQYLDNGVLIMEYIEGRYLDYHKDDICQVIECIADIHNIAIPQNRGLMRYTEGASDVIRECEAMFSKYNPKRVKTEEYKDLFNQNIHDKIDTYMKYIKKLHSDNISKVQIDKYSIINTDLNSTNFLINNNYVKMIDWEKPCIGDAAQDLGHFLAPTTTFWKTDKIFSKHETDELIKYYMDYSLNTYGKNLKDFYDRVMFYIKINCLRGITWCSMALMEYFAEKIDGKIYNQSTADKLKEYMYNMEELLVI